MTENQLNFDELPLYQERAFVGQGANLADLTQIEPIYERLLAEEIGSPEALERWILNRSELEAALDQQGSMLYIRMTCQTDDAARVQSYTDFLETIVPATKVFENRLNTKYLKEFERFALAEDRYGIYTRAVRTDIELFN
ncbi:MAG: hypothetical protein KAS92_09285, partial [Candidatus Omnitrophica bacterium]|nr:hypothetical protein [Candidatus Omnitrophota bacterium]